MIKKLFNKIKIKKKSRNNIMPIYLDKNKYFKKRKGYKINLNYLFKNNLFDNKIIFHISFIFIIIFILFLLLGPILRVNKIEIIRKDYITNIDIAYKSLDYIRGKSIFLINFDNIKNKLKKYQSNIKDITLNISFPDLLKIEVGSYPGLFNTNIKGTNYIITENGVFIPIKKYGEIKDLVLIYKNLENIPILDYKKIIDSKYIKSINYLINRLQDNVIDLNMKKYFYYVNERELHIITKSGNRLIYNLYDNIDIQIKKTVILNKQYFKINNIGIIYIDFRIKDKIYYCKDEIKSVCLGHIKRIYGK